MRYRCLIVLLGLVTATSLSPSAALAEGSNDGLDHAPATAAPPTGAADTAAGAFHRIKRPNAKYTGGTCVVDLSAIADFTELEEVSGCGVTVNLGAPMVKRSVPGSWATWGKPAVHRDGDPARAPNPRSDDLQPDLQREVEDHRARGRAECVRPLGDLGLVPQRQGRGQGRDHPHTGRRGRGPPVRGANPRREDSHIGAASPTSRSPS